MDKDSEKIIKSVKVVWERDYFKNGGTRTKRDIEGEKNKKDVLDSIVDIMEMGKVNLVDLLLHLSPKR